MNQYDAALQRATAKARQTICLVEHPVYHVHCLRNIGHVGQHWFTTRWESADTAEGLTRRAIDEAIKEG